MVSSLGGSAFQAFFPPAIATSFVGVTAFPAVMGGAGAYLGGARSPEEILLGVLAGAMTGALNHGAHEIQKELNVRDKIGKLATSLGISKDVTEKLIRFAAQGRNLKDIKDVRSLIKGLKLSGYAFAGVSVIVDLVNYSNNQSTSNLLRLAGDVAAIASGPIGGAIYGLLEISGLNNKIYDLLGNGVDKSINRIGEMYKVVNQSANPLNYIPNF